MSAPPELLSRNMPVPRLHPLDSAPAIDWRSMKPADHFVQFYENDDVLLRSVASYLNAGLDAGEACVVIATQAHLDELGARLTSFGHDLASVLTLGQFIALDASQALSTFMRDDRPDRRLFQENIGSVVAKAAANGRPVRAFGEMVALLYAEGNHVGAAELENTWNELAKSHRFQLFCAYPMIDFDGLSHTSLFSDICSAHSHVVPAESYSETISEPARMREIALLQQKAQALEAEVIRRKKVEENLLRRERELSDFFDNAVEGIHQVGPDGRIIWANRAELDILGYLPHEYIGHHISAFHTDQAIIAEMLARLQKGETLYNESCTLKCKDGTTKQVLIHSNACFVNGEFVYSRCFTRDVTEFKVMEVALQDQLLEIESLNRRLKRAVTETHHRVKNNLQLMSAMIDMQAMEHKAADAVPLSEFVRLRSHVQTLAIVHDLLTSRVGMAEDAESVSTQDVLHRLLPMLQKTAWNKAVHYEIADVGLPSKQCVSLSLIINELVSNAIKHGDNKITLRFRVDGKNATLEVEDDGPGFRADFDALQSFNTGLELVESLVRTDLLGCASFATGEQGGGLVRVHFPLPTDDI